MLDVIIIWSTWVLHNSKIIEEPMERHTLDILRHLKDCSVYSLVLSPSAQGEPWVPCSTGLASSTDTPSSAMAYDSTSAITLVARILSCVLPHLPCLTRHRLDC